MTKFIENDGQNITVSPRAVVRALIQVDESLVPGPDTDELKAAIAVLRSRPMTVARLAKIIGEQARVD